MKVKVGNKIYDGNEEPVMIILSIQDKNNIRDMMPCCVKYCSYPANMSVRDAEKFMEI